LIAERFSRARRHHTKHIASGEHVGDDILLRTAEVVQTESIPKNLQRIRRHLVSIVAADERR